MLKNIKPWQWIVGGLLLLEALFIYRTYLTYPGQFTSQFEGLIWWFSELSVILPLWLSAFGLMLYYEPLSLGRDEDSKFFAQLLGNVIIFCVLVPFFASTVYFGDYQASNFFNGDFESWVSLILMFLVTGTLFFATLYHSLEIHSALFEDFYGLWDRLVYIGLFLIGAFIFPTTLFRFLNSDLATYYGSFFMIGSFIFMQSINHNANKRVEAANEQRLYDQLK